PERAAAPLRPSRGTTSVDAPGGAAIRVSSEARTEPRLRKVIESLQKRAARASTLTGPGSVPGAPTGGAPLAPSVRDTLESTLQTDLQSVRVHTGARAQDAAASLSARAFTFGNHVFLGPGERATDAGLLAHEAAHVVQQQGAPVVQRSAPGQGGAHEQEAQRASEAVGRGEPFNVRERTSGFRAQRLGIGNPLNYFAEKANNIPGFRMFTVALGMNPINMTPVDRSAANVMRAAVELIPGGALITEALNNHGVFDRAGSWVEQQIRSLGLNGNEIHAALTRFVESLKLADLLDPGGVWERAQRIFTEPIQRLTGFLGGLVSGIGQLIKDAILRPLARLAEGTRGYDLLKAVLRQDPITGEPVQADAEALIGGFMKLIGQEETWENLKRGNAVGRAWAWFQGALGELLGFVRQVPGQFLSALRSLEIADIVLLPRAFAKVASAFGGFIGRFLSWAGNAVWNLLEIIFSVVAPKVMPYLRRAAATFRTILRDPIGFIGNLVKAGLQGLRQFAGRFLTHLRASLIGWLTGAMSGAGIYIPQGFTLVEVLKFVLSVLRLTWQSLRQKLMRAVGEPAVRAMETTFDLVRTLVTQGPAAAWEQIQQSVSNLRDMVMEQVMTFVRDRVVQAAITRLVTSLNPAGAFIQAIIATYNTVMFFVERMSQIAQVAASVIDSLAAIASGAIGAAANRVEQTMAGLLTLVISFLARIAGLGRVSDAVTNVINAVRQPIDRGLDRVVDWIVAQAKKLGRFVAQAGLPQDPAQRLQLGMQTAVAAVRRLASGHVSRAMIDPALAVIRLRYGFKSLTPLLEGGVWQLEGEINPKTKLTTEVKENLLKEARNQFLATFKSGELNKFLQTEGKLGRTSAVTLMSSWEGTVLFVSRSRAGDAAPIMSFNIRLIPKDARQTVRENRTSLTNEEQIRSYRPIVASILGADIATRYDTIIRADDYRDRMRVAIAGKFMNNLPGLHGVFESGTIPSKHNQIRGHIFELWCEQNLGMSRPGPIFVITDAEMIKKIKRNQIRADGAIGNALVDSKARTSRKAPSNEDMRQMDCYEYIINQPKNKVIDSQANTIYPGPYRKVIYIFSTPDLIPYWLPVLEKRITQGRVTARA
ncbi:DUF4157 domain-containing protein, partial [Corallococcus exiguus]